MTDRPLSQIERVVDTFAAPRKTFTDILRDQSWWLPFLLSATMTYGYLFAIQSTVGWNTVVQNRVRQSPKAAERMARATPKARVQSLKFRVHLFQFLFYGWPVLSILGTAFIAIVLWATISGIFGGKTTFGHVFAVWRYGTLPAQIKSLLAIITLVAGLRADTFNLSNDVPTSPGYFLPPNSAIWLKTLAVSCDLTWLWSLALVGVGLAIVSKVKRSAGLAVVFGWWLSFLLLRVGYAAING